MKNESQATAAQQEYTIGVMTMEVEGRDSERFRQRVAAAIQQLEEALTAELALRVDLIEFEGPHLVPTAGAYAPLDFLQIGLSEKLERNVQFLLIVTEVDLAASTLSYTLALPSQLTNIGIISTKRLSPSFWGDTADEALVVRRLTALLLHTFGHLLNMPHSTDPQNAMYDFTSVDDLNQMKTLSAEQIERLRHTLPHEAHERVSRGGHAHFILRILINDWRSIAHAIARANPLRLITHLPTMITAALSVIIVVFFSAEVWDVASSVELYQLILFSLIAIAGATFALYRAFSFGNALGRGRLLAESTIVTTAATSTSLLLTMIFLFIAFALLSYLGIVTIFPRRLMETWPTIDPAVRTLDHIKLSLFVSALGLLAGSLGGRADSPELVRDVLFIDEET